MRRVDARRWRAARTLPELGALTALWLEGRLASQPGCAAGCGPDPETTGAGGETPDLVPVLAGLNRAGFLTDWSQPGIQAPDAGGRWWRQRAAVSGFADTAMWARLLRASTTPAGAGLLLVENPPGLPGARQGSGAVVVTTVNDHPYTEFGGRRSRSDLRFQYKGCHRDAVAAVCAAVQVAIIDQVWGRNDVLWPFLAALTVAPAVPTGRSVTH